MFNAFHLDLFVSRDIFLLEIMFIVSYLWEIGSYEFERETTENLL